MYSLGKKSASNPAVEHNILFAGLQKIDFYDAS